LKDVGWFDKNSDQETKQVGLKSPNQLGLYDMSGNVWEWCEDDWHDDYRGAPTDGAAWFSINKRGLARVYRGGAWIYSERGCRIANRHGMPAYRSDYTGFRLVLAPQPKP
ncbi:MAG: formylglycine-generating enzyme family protein, partial [Saprospiraceae bacterium]|nr:formylglycine-generating enzyme family protein [Saprospiraceae bacterium]